MIWVVAESAAGLEFGVRVLCLSAEAVEDARHRDLRREAAAAKRGMGNRDWATAANAGLLVSEPFGIQDSGQDRALNEAETFGSERSGIDPGQDIGEGRALYALHELVTVRHTRDLRRKYWSKRS